VCQQILFALSCSFGKHRDNMHQLRMMCTLRRTRLRRTNHCNLSGLLHLRVTSCSCVADCNARTVSWTIARTGGGEPSSSSGTRSARKRALPGAIASPVSTRMRDTYLRTRYIVPMLASTRKHLSSIPRGGCCIAGDPAPATKSDLLAALAEDAYP
jgi:hypothetical protein